MKQKTGVLIISFMFIMTSIAQAIQVSFHMGDVKIIRGGKAMRVSNGTIIQSGDIIKTGANGIVEILYNDNSKVIVREKSTVRIGSESLKNNENPALILGRVTGKFQKQPRDTCKIYGVTAVCAVRGTEFDVAVGQGGDTRVDVQEGRVEVSNPGGEVTLAQGEQAAIDVSENPAKGSKKDLVAWLDGKDRSAEKDAPERAGQYKTYLRSLDSEAGEGEVKAIRGMISSAKNEGDLGSASQAIDSAEERAEDGLMLAESAVSAIDLITSGFEKRKGKLHAEFERLRKEADRVREVQQRSYADIQSLKDEYNRTAEKITGSFMDESKKIKSNTDLDRVKPQIKKYDVK